MRAETKNILLFLALTFTFSSIFWLLLAGSHTPQTEHHLIVMLMWCPAASAILIRLFQRAGLKGMGWKLPNWRFAVAGFLIPILCCLCVYVPVWVSGIGGFPNPNFLLSVAEKFPNLPVRLASVLDFLWIGSLAMIPAGFAALGEEIGWRGYLVPELVKVTSNSRAALYSGIIWAVWHYPSILFSGYNNGLPLWYAVTLFTLMVLGFAYIEVWFRLKSASIWPCVLLHTSHNNFIELFFTPITVDKQWTKYFIDEFGIGLAVAIPLTALVLWRSKGLAFSDSAVIKSN